MQKQVTLVANPPKNDPANDKQKRDKMRLVLSEMDMDKATLIVYLQS